MIVALTKERSVGTKIANAIIIHFFMCLLQQTSTPLMRCLNLMEKKQMKQKFLILLRRQLTFQVEVPLFQSKLGLLTLELAKRKDPLWLHMTRVRTTPISQLNLLRS